MCWGVWGVFNCIIKIIDDKYNYERDHFQNEYYWQSSTELLQNNRFSQKLTVFGLWEKLKFDLALLLL